MSKKNKPKHGDVVVVEINGTLEHGKIASVLKDEYGVILDRDLKYHTFPKDKVKKG